MCEDKEAQPEVSSPLPRPRRPFAAAPPIEDRLASATRLSLSLSTIPIRALPPPPLPTYLLPCAFLDRQRSHTDIDESASAREKESERSKEKTNRPLSQPRHSTKMMLLPRAAAAAAASSASGRAPTTPAAAAGAAARVKAPVASSSGGRGGRRTTLLTRPRVAAVDAASERGEFSPRLDALRANQPISAANLIGARAERGAGERDEGSSPPLLSR
jgi:hypothetical protein